MTRYLKIQFVDRAKLGHLEQKVKKLFASFASIAVADFFRLLINLPYQTTTNLFLVFNSFQRRLDVEMFPKFNKIQIAT